MKTQLKGTGSVSDLLKIYDMIILKANHRTHVSDSIDLRGYILSEIHKDIGYEMMERGMTNVEERKLGGYYRPYPQDQMEYRVEAFIMTLEEIQRGTKVLKRIRELSSDEEVRGLTDQLYDILTKEPSQQRPFTQHQPTP